MWPRNATFRQLRFSPKLISIESCHIIFDVADIFTGYAVEIMQLAVPMKAKVVRFPFEIIGQKIMRSRYDDRPGVVLDQKPCSDLMDDVGPSYVRVIEGHKTRQDFRLVEICDGYKRIGHENLSDRDRTHV